MDAHSFKDQDIVTKLISKVRNPPTSDPVIEGEENVIQRREYWIAPSGIIPKAIDSDTPGKGLGFILRLDRELATPKLVRHTDENGNDVSLAVFNYTENDLIETGPTTPRHRAQEGTFGGLEILESKIKAGTEVPDFTCCECEFSKLHIASIVGFSIEKFKPSLVTTGQIVHYVRITCLADGATLDVTLPALNCGAIDCKEYDLSATALGSCGNIGIIKFGNDITCVPTGNPICEASGLPSGDGIAGDFTAPYQPLGGGVGVNIAPEFDSWSSAEAIVTLKDPSPGGGLSLTGVALGVSVGGGVGYQLNEWRINHNGNISFIPTGAPVNGETLRIVITRNSQDQVTGDFTTEYFHNGNLLLSGAGVQGGPAMDTELACGFGGFASRHQLIGNSNNYADLQVSIS